MDGIAFRVARSATARCLVTGPYFKHQTLQVLAMRTIDLLGVELDDLSTFVNRWTCGPRFARARIRKEICTSLFAIRFVLRLQRFARVLTNFYVLAT